jgi:hypothetical protein
MWACYPVFDLVFLGEYPICKGRVQAAGLQWCFQDHAPKTLRLATVDASGIATANGNVLALQMSDSFGVTSTANRISAVQFFSNHLNERDDYEFSTLF